MPALPLGLGGLISVTTTSTAIGSTTSTSTSTTSTASTASTLSSSSSSSTKALSGSTSLGTCTPPLCQEMRRVDLHSTSHKPALVSSSAKTKPTPTILIHHQPSTAQQHTTTTAIRASLTAKHRRAPPHPPLKKPAATGVTPSRWPLGPRDCNPQQHPRQQNTTKQNVPTTLIKLSTRLVPATNTGIMPVGDRPRQPHLSAAAARAANRTPLKPKVAGLGSSSSTPLARRRQAIRDDGSTSTSTAPSAVSSNVTPRSGPRQSRIDSAQSTPGGTPTPADRTAQNWGEGGYESGVAAQDAKLASDTDKFFYASDVKAIQRPLSVPQKPVSFFYANETKRPQEHASPRFFHANGAREGTSMRPVLSSSMSASVVPTASRAANRPTTSGSTTGLCVVSRPLSPIKAASTPAVHSSNSSPPYQPPSMLTESPPMLTTAKSMTAKRRVSLDAVPRTAKRGHARRSSVANLETQAVSQLPTSPSSSQPSSAPRSPVAPPHAMTMASIIQAAEELRERQVQSETYSPTKSSYTGDAVSELVANARRERKVQDLEITNASLEAINRTLERQLRKQTAEMRRYRRLSRMGRISLASGGSASRVPSAALTDAPVEDLSDLTEEVEEDSFLLDESELSSDDSFLAEQSSLASSKLAARRERDQQRLHLDLTKHQELLVDSQKMNQSLKRCLDWTEVLIKEGQKALAYKVRVSDVQFGGRVLAPPDEDEEDTMLFADDGPVAAMMVEEPLLAPPWIKGPQDRDSGIELPADPDS
ncbi:hypothetical protein CDD82_4738 [Ophiocordyceps australis]|uniref:Uncharacterized protein n=1 Tax=Ophiocordyceps australis TaxID=1399860 RepID=A0A2C5Z6Q7_9HYPO|nr:hypothetical protein CDD82_4738 [Ophiocordyceps australis]